MERREIGIINVGQPGAVRVGDDEYVLQTKDFLYIGMGNQDVSFSSLNGEKRSFTSSPLAPTKLSDTKSRPI